MTEEQAHKLIQEISRIADSLERLERLTNHTGSIEERLTKLTNETSSIAESLYSINRKT